MTFKHIRSALLLPLSVLTLGLLPGCGHGPRGDESNGAAREQTPKLVSRVSEPEIVHVDESKRMVTFRTNGKRMGGDFFVSIDRDGEQSAVLKIIDVPVSSPLRTADILEGTPNINDQVVKADAGLSDRLRETYREAEMADE